MSTKRFGQGTKLGTAEEFAPYLKTAGLRLGLLMNFNHKTLKEGLKRIVR